MKYKKPPWYVMAFAIVGVVIIILAFILEAVNNGGRGRGSSRDGPVTLQSQVQMLIDEIDEIEQYFLPINRFSRPGISLGEVNGIVIHNIGNPDTTALQNRNFFANLAETEDRFASSHFIICLDGSIIQCVPIDEIAYASNHRNDDTISIEICHPDETGRFTDESYEAAVRLTAWLCLQFDLTSEDVIRHGDIVATDCPRYFTANEDAWDTFRADVDRVIAEMQDRLD